LFCTVAAKAISIGDALAAAEEQGSGSAADTSLRLVHGLYASPGARILKRSRKGVCRPISLRIAVGTNGTFLYWFSFLRLRKKKFNLSTLCEVAEHADAGPSLPPPPSPAADKSLLIIRLRNEDRTLDFVVDNSLDRSAFSDFFNEFRR
jgi:hypothetical protein